MHFVLGTHLAQLRNAVMLAYGPQIDADTYLQKFIQLTFVLVDNPQDRSGRVTTKFMEYLVKSMDFEPDDLEVVQSTTRFITEVAEHQDLSLRTIERIISTLALALAYSNTTQMRLPPVLGGLCVLKVISPALYVKAKKGMLGFWDIKEIFNLEIKPENEEGYNTEWAIDW